MNPEFTDKMKKISSDLVLAFTEFFQDKAVEAHLSGSIAKGSNDALSDIDIWFTFEDTEIENILNDRFEYYARFGKIVILHEMQNNFPLNGVQTAVMYKIDGELIRVDFYLCPLSSATMGPDSKILFEKAKVIEGEMIYETKRTPRDLVDRITFLIMMCFVGIKKVIRQDEDFMNFLFTEFEKTSDKIPELSTVPKESNLASIKAALAVFNKVSNPEQQKAILEISKFLEKLEGNLINFNVKSQN